MSAISWVLFVIVFLVVGYGVYWASKKTLEEKPDKTPKIVKKKGK